jgi:hypothetical protein
VTKPKHSTVASLKAKIEDLEDQVETERRRADLFAIENAYLRQDLMELQDMQQRAAQRAEQQ